MARHKKIIERVSEVYKWIEEQRFANSGITGSCEVCGKCCDFEQYDHRLYVTSPEMIYFVEKIGKANVKQMATAKCCYQVEGKCSVYAYRFSGCRIFCCKGEAGFQSELTEAVIKKFKAVCDELQIPYRYVELPVALKISVTAKNAE